ncbi:MAG: cation:dicarboxylase symporter family transporter [Cyanobacteria bacterium P01_D01_bin.1]
MLASQKIRPRQWHLLEKLRSPWAILASVALAVYVGTNHPVVAETVAPFGDLYLGLLKMCVLPILLSAITASIGRLMSSADAKRYIQRILVVFPVSLLMASSVASAIAFIIGPGRNLSEETLANLGVLVNDSSLDYEVSLSGVDVIIDSGPTMSEIVMTVVPENIFSALSEGQTLKVLFFSIMFGISLGLLREEVTSLVFPLLDSVFKSFNQLMQWLTLLLPLGLFSLLSYQLAHQGMEVILSMINFVLVALVAFTVIYGLSTIVIWQQTQMSLPAVFATLREPTLLALATSSSFACLPSAIATLSNSLKFDKQTTNLVTPLAITLCRFGAVIYFALASLFVAQLYDKAIGPLELGLIIVASIVAGMATSGVTGILTLTMLGIVLDPLGLPLEAVLVLFIAIDPLLDPMRTLGIVHTAIAVTAVIAEEQGTTVSPTAVPPTAVPQL